MLYGSELSIHLLCLMGSKFFWFLSQMSVVAKISMWVCEMYIQKCLLLWGYPVVERLKAFVVSLGLNALTHGRITLPGFSCITKVRPFPQIGKNKLLSGSCFHLVCWCHRFQKGSTPKHRFVSCKGSVEGSPCQKKCFHQARIRFARFTTIVSFCALPAPGAGSSSGVG